MAMSVKERAKKYIEECSALMPRKPENAEEYEFDPTEVQFPPVPDDIKDAVAEEIEAVREATRKRVLARMKKT